MSIFRKIKRKFTPQPPKSRHAIRTFIMSVDDEVGKADKPLIDLSTAVITEATRVDVEDIANRSNRIGRYVRVWPGEHYKLLVAFARTLRPASIIEIGTATGASALCLARGMPETCTLTTFDIVPWNEYPDTVLTAQDMTNVRQVIGDLSDETVFQKHRSLLEGADFIFADGPKDGKMEQRLWALMRGLTFKPNAHLLFDDIRVPEMLGLWREINRPKIDLTSFGHWSGTGLIRLG